MCVKFIVLFVVSKRLCYIVTCLAIIKQDVTCLAIIKQDVTCLAIVFSLGFRSVKQDVTCLAIIKQDVTCLAIIKQDVTCLAIMFILEFRSLKQDHNYSTTARADSVAAKDVHPF